MTTRFAAVLSVVFLLAGQAGAQTSKRKAASSDGEDAGASPSGRSGSRRKDAVESYLKGRINQLDKMHKVQQDFGRRMYNTWRSFWVKMYQDRNLFEVRMARQRLNLFESLNSLHPATHPQNLADYDKLQNDEIRSFETTQKASMEEFFARMVSEIKQFANEQEKQRSEFAGQAVQSWHSQQKNPTLVPQ